MPQIFLRRPGRRWLLDGAPSRAVRRALPALPLTFALASPQGSPAAVPSPIAEDPFDRTASGSWGAAPAGGPWAPDGSSAPFSVADGSARALTPPGQERLAVLPGVQARDVDAQVVVDVPAVEPEGAEAYGYVVLRHQASGGTYLRVGLKATGGGPLELRAQTGRGLGLVRDAPTGLAATPGRYVLRVQAEGAGPTVLRARAWRAGTQEPGTWALETTTRQGPQQAGALGLRSIAVGTARPVTVGFDDLRASTLAGGPGAAPEEPAAPADPAPGLPQEPDTRGDADSRITGERRVWHPLALTVDGPASSEVAEPSPFLDHRMTVTLRNGSSEVEVPGFFAADGRAAETGATAGRRWRANFTPDRPGTWSYEVSFRRGENVAVSDDEDAGRPEPGVHGLRGSFTVGPADTSAPGHLGKGMLRYAGRHHLRFAGTGEHFLKVGANSPENLLAFGDFDGTRASHDYAPHVRDHRPGDPTWRGGRGKGLIGGLSYLAGEGMNAVFFLTMNVGGDGRDVWPWTSSGARTRYDVSKLDQWGIAFAHMDRVGLMQHVVLQETENDHMLDGGRLGTERRLYHRELVARFGHHLALQWNLGEENENPTAQRRQFAAHLRAMDPYDHPIVVHNGSGWPPDQLFGPLLSDPSFEGTSLQLLRGPATVHAETVKWTRRSADAGRPWAVAVDELGPAAVGVAPDRVDPRHDTLREQALWGNLMAGGGGVEWYFGYAHAHDDLDLEDWRSRAAMWRQSRHAVDFFQSHLPFERMRPADELSPSRSDYVLAAPGEVYAVYLPDAGEARLDLGGSARAYEVSWYDPRNGGALQAGSRTSVRGPGTVSLGTPPGGSGDWVALVR